MRIIYTTTVIKSRHFLVERFSSCCIFRSFSRSSLLRLFSLSHPPTCLPKFSSFTFPFLPHFLFLSLCPFPAFPFSVSNTQKKGGRSRPRFRSENYFFSSNSVLMCSSFICCSVTKFGACIIRSCALPFKGNKITSRMIGSSKSSITSRSIP